MQPEFKFSVNILTTNRFSFLLFLGLMTAILIAIPRHPHPSTLKGIEVTGK